MMSVKPPHCLFNRIHHVLDRLQDIVLGDWWIDVILMLFIVSMILYEHYN